MYLAAKSALRCGIGEFGGDGGTLARKLFSDFHLPSSDLRLNFWALSVSRPLRSSSNVELPLSQSRGEQSEMAENKVRA